jgi:hypothetical protein
MYSYDMWVPSVRVKANNKNIVVKIFVCHHEKIIIQVLTHRKNYLPWGVKKFLL